ncbi:SMP-30/gluconolactonase/LRE family protein [Treponema parvum]|uniref:SMP-30/gluconolactonase/LRE family protein n=1 Tax=Treponema parvum TaxID=138851 RepID=A0A975F406_9SPIR|nr:SMP-30/gluconolactonase/LRE family protein [Treponema parvum]QTQ14036.1 SMP-30/gluconolactonase/LRE family protein [Treponema parvum]
MVKKYNKIFPQCELGENSRWNEFDQMFYYTDIVNGAVYRTDLKSEMAECVLKTNYQIGAFLFDSKSNIVLLTEKGLIYAYKNGKNYALSDKTYISFSFEPGERFNDAIVDSKGRILAGIKKESNSNGRLISIDKDGNIKTLLTGLGISNGMGFDDNCKIFYHTDSTTATITRWNYNPDTGDISNPKVVISDYPEGQVPDGMCLDNNGDIISACWGGSSVLRISKTGEILEKIELPATNISSVSIGGKNMDTLFITSAFSNLKKIEEADGLCYYLTDTSIKGKRDYLA